MQGQAFAQQHSCFVRGDCDPCCSRRPSQPLRRHHVEHSTCPIARAAPIAAAADWQSSSIPPATGAARIVDLRTAAVASPDVEAVASQAKPTSAEVARTIVSLATHGTLATVGEDSVPLGTYASYVLDAEGQPILRLRKEAVHTANLLQHPRCSLFVQPADMPARLLARATLIGQIEQLGAGEAEDACARHAQLHFGGVGVDAPQPSDLFYRLRVEKCFYVGGMGAACQAEVLAAAEYQAAEPDPLRDCAAGLVAHLNAERTEDVLRIGAFALGVPLDALQGAQLLWLDRLGIYLFAATTGGPGAQVVRVTFAREVTDERDARSTLTMLAQVAWERERNYIPVMSSVPDPVAS